MFGLDFMTMHLMCSITSADEYLQECLEVIFSNLSCGFNISQGIVSIPVVNGEDEINTMIITIIITYIIMLRY